jgi:hypothetical protein
VEEPTALTGDFLLPRPSPQHREIESSEIEAVPKIIPSKDSDVHYSQSVLPHEVTSLLPCQCVSEFSLSMTTGFQ